MNPRPFLKWVGGKQKLLPQITEYLPHGLTDGSIDKYVESFAGGGALFFYLRSKYAIRNSILIDVNPDLIILYKVIRDRLDELIPLLNEFQQAYDSSSIEKREELFYETRNSFNYKRMISAKSKEIEIDSEQVERSAQMIFLNKTCFNGLYRLNKRKMFNAPFGKYEKPTIFDAYNLKACSCALENTHLIAGNYTLCEQYLDERTFVYFDPPYKPISATSSFTSYAGNEFGDDQQSELAVFFEQTVAEKGAYGMLSNSDPLSSESQSDFFETRFSHSYIHRIMAARAINSKGNKRGKIPELLILNYGEEERKQTRVQQTLGFNI